MLQQTQVATVIPYFQRFMARFPKPADLASAEEQEVLRIWQGLGYYARARHLRAAACRIVADFSGKVPDSLPELRSLAGVGRYTAGAVASIAYDLRAPILDGNVARVLCRLEKIQSDPREPATAARLWRTAEQILPDKRVGEFNSGLMELGATICTVKSPRCGECPVQRFCQAAAAGVQDSIPIPRKSKATPLLRRWTICVARGDRWLLEQRPAKGRWAGMWQFVTLEAGEQAPTCAMLGSRLGLRVSSLRSIGQVRHALTHRRYVFDVFSAVADGEATWLSQPIRRWLKLAELDQYPLPRPQLRIAGMLQAVVGYGGS
jgi:A/G-specific adenine glycosylase